MKKVERVDKGYWLCKRCGIAIFVTQNMVMIRDDIWLEHFEKSDCLCDECIEEGMDREIRLSDLKMNGIEMIPCNMFWLENKTGKQITI